MGLKDKVLNIYKNKMYSRCDNKEGIFYFSEKDFPLLDKKTFVFKSNNGYDLVGGFYHYPNKIKNENQLIIFDHGFGNGHNAYFREIEKLCSNGFKVFSYDHTGCMKSGGEGTRGFGQSLQDLIDCIKALKSHEEYKNFNISVIGHSWGGYSTGNIAKFFPEIKHIIVLSGFISVKTIINQNFSWILSFFRKRVFNLEKETNPYCVNSNMIDALKNFKGQGLLIYSNNDKLVKKSKSFNILKRKLKNNKNIELILEEKKGHNPNYTTDAVEYMNNFFTDFSNKLKNKELTNNVEKEKYMKSFDWYKMTEQDNNIWLKIFNTLEK